MLSIIITSYNEPQTIGRAIESFLNQDIKDKFEILVVAPDIETGEIAKQYSKTKWIKDKREGKPAALNLAIKEAKGEFLIFTDGDVFVSQDSVEQLLKPFKDPTVGIVSGRPISLNTRKTMLGYWSHLLTDEGAHTTRLDRTNNKQFIVVSGYLFAMRNIINRVPEDVLSEDAIISHTIWQKGYFTDYAPNAKVYVKYPNTFADWILQKKRSAGGYQQIKNHFRNPPRMRSLTREIMHGWYKPLIYAKNPKELIYSLLLYPARLYLWFVIFKDINIKKVNILDIWKPIESTK